MRKHLRRIWYSYIGLMDKDKEVTFLNYGYVDKSKRINLMIEDEYNRYPIQLYNHVATAIKLSGLDVLEVGCGRGGGSAYIYKYLGPRSILGVDYCKKSIEFCIKQDTLKGLSFQLMDAQKLSCKDESFDAVINVESSHCYENMDQFLTEVRRVLRPKGFFLYADFRDKNDMVNLKEQLLKSQLKIIKEEMITSNVRAALELDTERRLDLISRLAPRLIQKLTKEFTGTNGSKTYNSFSKRDKEYYLFVLKKS